MEQRIKSLMVVAMHNVADECEEFGVSETVKQALVHAVKAAFRFEEQE